MGALARGLRVVFQRLEERGEAASAVVVRDALRLVETLEGQPIMAIIAERFRQVDVEGWTTDHDDRHAYGEMAKAAAAYALQAARYQSPHDRRGTDYPMSWWPWERRWWKPRSATRDLERAGALIVAELERLDRAATRRAGNA